jgi:alpha-tubulin suppressor-like RCC1 family protein
MGRVAAGTRHTCAIRDNGNVRCWGSNDSGQLGADIELPFVGDDEDPARVSNLEIDFGRDVVQVTAGFGHTCVLFEGEDGKVRCWGRVVGDQTLGTVVGLLGTDDVELNRLGFVNPLMTGDVRLSEPAVQISAASGDAHTCALLASGKVSCWGINDRGQCGIGNRSASVGGASNEVLPTIDLDPNDPDMRAVQVSAGDGHTCALLSKGGRVTCWGLGSNGRLGYGDNSDRLAPRDSVAIGEPALQIAAGSGHTCALLERGRVRCWGDNTDGVLGYGHDVDIGDDETPEQAVTMLRSPNSSAVLGGDARIGGAGVVQITAVADTNAMCARFASGVVRCWGQNGRGQLGYGHTETLGAQFPPEALYYRSIGTHFAGGDVPLGGLAVALAGGGRCALVRPEGASTSTARSSLYCWGTNSDAQLGLPAAFTIGSHTRTPVELGPVFWEE